MADVDWLIQVQQDSYSRAGSSLASSWPPESAMDADELRRFVGQRHYCVLATTSRNGHAVARPVAFTVYAGAVWFATVSGPRLRNLERVPWASVVIEAGDRGGHRAVVLDGPVDLTGRPAPDVVDAWEQRHGNRAEWADRWFALRPERVLSYTAEKRGQSA